MTAPVIEEDCIDFDKFVARRRLLLIAFVTLLTIGGTYYAYAGITIAHAVSALTRLSVPLVEAVDWNHQVRIPTPAAGDETAEQLQNTVNRLFYSERHDGQVVEIPSDQDVFIIGYVPQGPYASYFPATASPEFKPIMTCRIEKHGYLTQIGSERGRVLFVYSAPSKEYYEPNVPNRCQGNELMFEQLK